MQHPMHNAATRNGGDLPAKCGLSCPRLLLPMSRLSGGSDVVVVDDEDEYSCCEP
jgi:hypothetical protein